MGRKFNLGGDRARELKKRSQKRAEKDRESFLENWPNDLARKEFHVQPTPAKEVAKVVKSASGYAYTEYKSLAKLSVPFEGPGGFRYVRRTLPDIFEVTEIVYSGVEVEDLDED